ncbi:NAD-dependent epimerase/dehydratase family protein [Elusimicrobiota bacterium]
MSKPTALVTGACGFVGSHMVDLLLSDGFEVCATDRKNAPKKYLSKEAKFIAADITDVNSLEDLFDGNQFDKIYHIAALYDYIAPWERLYRINCLGTKNLMDVIAKKNPKASSVIIWSSGAVFGDSFKKEPLKETDFPWPSNEYEKSKYIQETIALEYVKSHNIPVTVIRPSAIYGPRSMYGISVPVFLMKKGILRFIPGPGTARGAFAHVEDVVGSALFLSKKPEASGEIFNVCDDSPVTMREALLTVAAALDVMFLDVCFPLWPVMLLSHINVAIARVLGIRPFLEPDLNQYMAEDFWMDNNKLKSFGYKLRQPDIKKGLAGAIAWYRKEGII